MYDQCITDEMIKEASLNKEAIAPLALLPLAVKGALGLMTAHGIYSGAKDISKGNYGSGAFNLATSIPFIGWAGKGLKAVGTAGRVIGRGGKIGNLGKRVANAAFSPAQQAARLKAIEKATKAGKTLQEAQAIGNKAVKSMPAAAAAENVGGIRGIYQSARQGLSDAGQRATDAYYRAGAGGARPAGQSTLFGSPSVSEGIRGGSKAISRYGQYLTRAGKRIDKTMYGKAINSFPGLIAAPLVGDYIFGDQYAPHPSTYSHAAGRAQQYTYPSGFAY